jgi:hypothetical protein
MYKRKIMNSQIRYQDTHPQNTGFSRRRDCSFSKAYDWRDDPYELMLLQQRLHKLLQGFARQVEKRHLHLPNKKSILF